ncbi:unnamed protein product [Sphacelaria rigidula]
MKKISTGERIKFADLRRRSVGGPRGDADSDVTTEQLFVSELMDTTPSSSYEEETWRTVYNPRDTSASDSPLVRYDSDAEAADEVVTDKQEVVGKADLIVKEDVPELPQITEETETGSLLARGLAAVKNSGPSTNQTSSTRQRDDTHSDGESLMGDPRIDRGADHSLGGCTAQQLIGSLISECKSLELGSDLTQGTESYVLRMAEEDWDPDLDIPGLDSSAVITDVGVDQFVLCKQGKIEPILHVNIALHKGLNGPLTGTGAMEAPGAGATMTLEVDFQRPGRDDTHHISMPIASDNGQQERARFRDNNDSRSGARSAAVSEVEELPRVPLGGGEKSQEKGADTSFKLRNIDTGEDIELSEIDARVPPSLDPGELFSGKQLA